MQRKPPQRPHRSSAAAEPAHAGAEDDDLLVVRGRSLGQRLLGLLAAFSFVALGLASVVPMLQPPRPEMPDQRRSPTASAAPLAQA